MAMIKVFAEEFLEGFKEFGKSISFLINFILLTLVYFLGVGLAFFMFKMGGSKPIKSELKKESYWSELNLTKKPLKEYFRQF